MRYVRRTTESETNKQRIEYVVYRTRTHRNLFDKLMNFLQVFLGPLVGKIGMRFLQCAGLILQKGTKLFDVLISDFLVQGIPRMNSQHDAITIAGICGCLFFGIIVRIDGRFGYLNITI
jgi:hypothetical protein